MCIMGAGHFTHIVFLTMAAEYDCGTCRFYESNYPAVDDLVMVCVKLTNMLYLPLFACEHVICVCVCMCMFSY